MTCVLYIDDDIRDVQIVRRMLEVADQNFSLLHAGRMDEAMQIINSQPVDIILSDIVLPDSPSREAFNNLLKIAADIPVVIMTDTHDESLAMEALQKGAQDYLLKGLFERDSLVRAIRYGIERSKFQKDISRARSRTKKLQQKARKLRQKSKQLRQVSEVKDEFISLASHQLRTPATGVKQYIGMILQGFAGEVSESQKELLRVAYESNERQLSIVDDLLRVAKIDAGRINLDKDETAIDELIGDILREQDSKFKSKYQSVSFEAPASSVMALVDVERLRGALENIIDNASKYTPRGQSIAISLEQTPKTIKIVIADTGVGVPENDIPKMFDKFSRVANPLSKTVGGSGIGLYWAKKVVGLHGGKINVKSKVNSGTTFTVTIPRGG